MNCFLFGAGSSNVKVFLASIESNFGLTLDICMVTNFKGYIAGTRTKIEIAFDLTLVIDQ